MDERVSSIEVSRVVSERTEYIRAVAPALLYLYPKAEVYLAAEKALHILTGISADSQ